ncbi:glycosyltransferase [Acidobacteria bacterium AH-259-D05]|nr:glycosyltransferase [Acidobacteria bacterium AH-259-D05]
MNSLKLSFCIPTYNRADFIGETLDSIISQATDEVEIVILDGGSSDNTEQVVYKYMKEFKRLRYFRQNFKGGVDRDLSKAVEKAKGEYCWLMPDDDLLKPGAVKTILDEINKDYSFIIVNGEMRNTDLSEVLEQKRLLFDTNQIYKPDNHDLLLIDTASYLTFTGAFVVKRSCWNKREKEKYYGSLFVEVGVIFQEELPGDTLVIAEPLIVIRYGNGEWVPRTFEIWMFKWPELIWGFPNFTESVKRQVCSKEPWRRLKELVKLRAAGAYSIDEYKKWLRPRVSSKWYMFKSRVIAQFPGFILNVFVIIYIYLFYPKAKGLLLNLKNSQYHWKNIFSHNA